MHQQLSAVCIHIGPWIFDFPRGLQDIWYHFIYAANDLKEFVVRHVFLSKTALCFIARIGLSQYSVTKAWDDLSIGQGLLAVVLDLLLGRQATAQFIAHALDPADDLLIGQAMQRTCQAGHSCCECEIGIAQGTSHQMDGVGRNISAFVIGMNGHVHAHHLTEFLAVVTKHMRKVACPVQVWIRFNVLPVSVAASVDIGCDPWKTTDQVHGVLIGMCPVFAFVDAVSVRPAVFTFRAACIDPRDELGHGMCIDGQSIDDFENVRGNDAPPRPIVADPTYFILCRQFIHQHQVEDPLRQGLFSFGRIFGQHLIEFRNAVASEAYAFCWIELGGFVDQRWHSPHARIELADRDLTHFLISVCRKELAHFANGILDLTGKFFFDLTHA